MLASSTKIRACWHVSASIYMDISWHLCNTTATVLGRVDLAPETLSFVPAPMSLITFSHTFYAVGQGQADCVGQYSTQQDTR